MEIGEPPTIENAMASMLGGSNGNWHSAMTSPKGSDTLIWRKYLGRLETMVIVVSDCANSLFHILKLEA